MQHATALETAFPHITEMLTQRWEHDAGVYLDNLLIDTRGGRYGFPPEVMSELLFLSILLWWRNHPDASQLEYQAEAFSFASHAGRDRSLANTE